MPLKPITDTALLGDRAYSAIRDAILHLELEPGAPLVESQLARALNASKTPVREALCRLEETGLVVSTPYRGFVVSELTLHDAWEILQIRAVLEGLAVREACEALTETDLEALAALLEEQRAYLEQGELDACAESGYAFHRILVEKAGNSRLCESIDRLNDQFHRVRLLSSHIPGRLPKSLVEHHEILEALRERDEALAERRMNDHLLAVYEDVAQDGHLKPEEQVVSP